MKLKLIAVTLSILFLSGCTSKNDREYENICKNLPEGFYNKNLQQAYNKEKGIYIESNDGLDWLYTSLPRKNNRWEFVEVDLKQDLTYGFPQEDGLFRIYRDYNFNNCIEYVSFDNKHTDIDGDFCLAFKKIEIPSANLRLDRWLTNINSKTKLLEFEIKIKKDTFLKTNIALFSSSYGNYGCKGLYYDKYRDELE